MDVVLGPGEGGDMNCLFVCANGYVLVRAQRDRWGANRHRQFKVFLCVVGCRSVGGTVSLQMEGSTHHGYLSLGALVGRNCSSQPCKLPFGRWLWLVGGQRWAWEDASQWEGSYSHLESFLVCIALHIFT
eukprot:jgi/Botrbrau1/22010/Bobra.0024s0026.1